MNLSRKVVCQIVFLILLSIVVSSSSNELSDDESSCPADKESCGCSGTNRPEKDVSVENSKNNDVSSNDVTSNIDNKSGKEENSPGLNRPENVEFPRRNQMVFIKGIFIHYNSTFKI